jgi:DNA-binding NtrC family response regulator
MSKESWLISWIGDTDHRCAEGLVQGQLGPIASAAKLHTPFGRIHLLTNYDHTRSANYCSWLEQQVPGVRVDLFEIDLSSPINYAEIYAKVSEELKQARLPREDVELTFHLSPGTPAMAAIWILLAKTRFPARLIQTSQQRGLESVNFSFDLANDFLPEFLQRGDERAERLVSAPLQAAPGFEKILHVSDAMVRQIEMARRIAAYDVPVLILGETGTGKELFAEAIHDASRRKAMPFVAVNCGAIPKELANSELFGHSKGAFTGAVAARKGHFREADGGTLFLDEVGDLSLDAQARLLRVLQQKEVTPVGESRPVKVDVRIVAATHRDLMADVAEGRFREDLFHRLVVGILHLPPLREREADIDLLTDCFLEDFNADIRGRTEGQEKSISHEGKILLNQHPWPGNVRELYHTLLRASIWSVGTTITPEDIRTALLTASNHSDRVLGRALGKGFDLQTLLDEVARHYLQRAMAQTGGRKKQAAELLGFSNYQTLGNWMTKLDVQNDDRIE